MNKARGGRHLILFNSVESDWLATFTFSAPATLIPPGFLLSMARRRLRMTMAQLGARAGVDSAHIARIERGSKDARWGTYAKLFRALECEFVPCVKPKESFAAIEEGRIQQYAEERLKRWRSEDPKKRWTKAETTKFIESEKADLRQRRDSALWSEEGGP